MSSNREQIMAKVETVLEAVAIGNGYNNNLTGRVSRLFKHWGECNSFPQVFIIDAEERKTIGPNNLVSCELDTIIWGYEKHSQAPYTQMNALLQDVEKALCANPTLDALAIDTIPGTVSTDEGWLLPYGIFQFTVTIIYRYTYGSP